MRYTCIIYRRTFHLFLATRTTYTRIPSISFLNLLLLIDLGLFDDDECMLGMMRAGWAGEPLDTPDTLDTPLYIYFDRYNL